jgi:hypothetical protein
MSRKPRRIETLHTFGGSDELHKRERKGTKSPGMERRVPEKVPDYEQPFSATETAADSFPNPCWPRLSGPLRANSARPAVPFLRSGWTFARGTAPRLLVSPGTNKNNSKFSVAYKLSWSAMTNKPKVNTGQQLGTLIWCQGRHRMQPLRH